tara:strand:- start:576 stop:845 length:270 start_codon:yes stop_codon:yes gene_type:complete
MAEHYEKKYIAKVEKTLYTIETIEFIAATEKEAEEMLDDYCAGELDDSVKITETEIQEEDISGQWIEESEPLTVDEFMKIDGGQSAYRD